MTLLALIYTIIFIFIYRAELTLEAKIFMGLLVLLIAATEIDRHGKN